MVGAKSIEKGPGWEQLCTKLSLSFSFCVYNIRVGEAQRKGEGESGNEARLKYEVTFDDFP